MKKSLNILAVFTLITTFLLINLGGLVHNTGSSLACPDWPLCYGQVMPEMVGGVLIEHSHRLLATFVGFLIVIIFFISFFYSKIRKIKLMTVVLLVMVIFQGVLGGITVIYKLPTIISTMHLALSMIFFCSLIFFINILNPKKISIDSETSKSLFLVKQFFFILFGLIYIQIVLGAAIRHLGLGGVCGVGEEHFFLCFDMINFTNSIFQMSKEAILHSIHRYMGALLGIGSISFFLYLHFKKIINSKWVYRRFFFLIILITFQIFLGIYSVVTEIGILTTTLHLGGASLVLALAFDTWLKIKFSEQALSFEKKTIKNTLLKDIISVTKPRLSGLVMFTCFLGMVLAPGSLSPILVLITLFSLSIVVAGACAFNCYLERELDGLMERTASRPLPSKRLNPHFVMIGSIFAMILGIALLFIFINFKAGILATVASVFYVAFYTPLKKISPWSLFIGAIPGAIPPLVGWVAVTDSFGFWGLILFAILYLWQLPHFLSISIYHYKDYLKANLKIFPTVIGNHSTKVRIVFYSFLLLALSLLPYYLGRTDSYIYAMGSLLLGMSFTYIAFIGLKKSSEELEKKWARSYFISSIIYLPLQLAILVIYGN